MTNRKDVELLIRATNQSKQTLQGVSSDVDGITDSLKKQAEAAKAGDASLDSLKESLNGLQQAGKGLIAQQGLIDQFNRQAAALESLSTRAEEARTRYEEFQKELAGSDNVTATQQKRLDQMGRVAEQLGTRVAAAGEKLEATSAKLADVGIATDNLTKHQEELVQTSSQVGEQIQQAQKQISSYASTMAEAQRVQAEYEATMREMAQAADLQAAAIREAAQAENEYNAAAKKSSDAQYLSHVTQLWAELDVELKKVEEDKQKIAAADAQAAKEAAAYTEQMKKEQAAFDKAHADATAIARESQYVAQLNQALEQEAAKAKLAADAQTRLREAQGAVTTATQRQTAATEGLNAAFARDGSRETLSTYQRIRGELIGLAVAYVGVQSAIGLAGDAIEAYVQKQAVENRLGVVLGDNDPTKIAAQYSYLHDQAIRLGIGINELADSYSKFALAAKNANLNLPQTQYAFERITEAMRVNHASTEQINGAFQQLEQMLSKNKVQMDDLRQASNWLPGLEGMLAKGLGFGSVKQLFDQMQKGSVDAKTAILGLAQEMERVYAKQLPDALQSLQAEQGRFTTSVQDFQRTIANAGFANAYIDLLKHLQEAMNGAQGQALAKNLSDAFSTVAKIIETVVDNIQELATILEGVLGVKALQWVQSTILTMQTAVQASADLAAAQAALATAQEAAAASGMAAYEAFTAEAAGANAAAPAVSKLAGALGLVSKALSVLMSGFVGWQIGQVLDEKFSGIHKWTSIIVEDFGYAWDVISLGFEMLIDKMANAVKTLPSRIGNGIKELAASSVEAYDAEAAQIIRNSKTTVPDQQSGGVNPDLLRRFQQAKSVHQALLAQIDQHGGYAGDGRSQTSADLAAADAASQAADPKAYQQRADLLKQMKSDEAEVNRLISERGDKIQEILDKQKAGLITSKQRDEQTKATFDSYGPKFKQLVDTAEKNIKPLIDAMGLKAPLKDLQEYQSKLQAAVGVYQPNLEVDAKDKNASRRESMAQSLENELRTVLARGDRNAAPTGDDPMSQYNSRIANSVKAINEQYDSVIDKVKKFQSIGGSSIGGVSTSSYLQQLEAAKQTLKTQAQTTAANDQMKADEKQLTDLVKLRTDAYKDVEDQVKAGTLTGAQGFEQATDKVKDFNAEIIKAAQAAIDFNNKMRGTPGVTNAAIDSANAKLGAQIRDAQGGGTANAAFSKSLADSSASQANDIIKQRNELTQQYNNLVKLGLMTQSDAQDKLKQDYDSTNDALVKAIDNYQELIDAEQKAGTISQTNYDLRNAQIKEMRSQIQLANPDVTKLRDTFQQTFTGSVVQGADDFAQTLAGLIDGTEKLSDSWKDFGRAIGTIFADFIRNIANAIIQIQAMKIAQSITNSASFTGITGLFTAAVSHSGSIVGSGTTSRPAPLAAFIGAPRYHNGTNGPLGLKADEYPTILQKGEEVLSKDNPRNVLNGGGGAAGGAVAGNGIRQVLAIGDDEIASAMSGASGDAVHLTWLKRNKVTIKNILGS